ncbi:hypothetical protein ACP4OV_015028 [Aristida adscensionis]
MDNRNRDWLQMLPQPNWWLLNGHVLSRVYLDSLATMVIAFLAFTWSTVVLLGSFVTSLEEKDFWCLTVICLCEALSVGLRPAFISLLVHNWMTLTLFVDLLGLPCRIFNDLESDAKLAPNLLKFLGQSRSFIASAWLCTPRGFKRLLVLPYVVVIVPVTSVIWLMLMLLKYGPIAFLVLPTWRLVQRDYGATPGGANNSTAQAADPNKARLMMPSLDIFYSLVLIQGVLHCLLYLIATVQEWFLTTQYNKFSLPRDWGKEAISRYLSDTRARYKRDPASVGDANMFSHATGLLGSESWGDYVSGVRVVGTFLKRGVQGSRMSILASREKVQKLIDTLGLASYPTDQQKEARELSATIVAELADSLHLVQYPGALQCISSLLETTHDSNQEKVTSNELVLQGLAIIEKLALNIRNCQEMIERAPGLLEKIKAPVYSETLINDIKNSGFAAIVNGTLKVLYQLIHTSGSTERWLPDEMSWHRLGVTNLEMILDQDSNAQELQMRAMEILTELALISGSEIRIGTDIEAGTMQVSPASSIDATIRHLMKKQLQFFFANEGQQEPAATKFIKENQLRTTSGKTMALLSRIRRDYSMILQNKEENIVGMLTEALDPGNNITYRIIAVDILGNLFAHDLLSHKIARKDEIDSLKTTLIPKVLKEILHNQTQNQTETFNTSEQGQDEESQEPRGRQPLNLNGQNKTPDKGNEEKTAMKELQGALLYLILQLYNSIDTNSFDDEVKRIGPGGEGFVAKLKIVVEENREPTLNSLRIVKLCAQISVAMVQRKQYIGHFKNKKFVESLSNASETMCNVESRILFTDTVDFQRKTKIPTRPLLSDLVKELEKGLEGTNVSGPSSEATT